MRTTATQTPGLENSGTVRHVMAVVFDFWYDITQSHVASTLRWNGPVSKGLCSVLGRWYSVASPKAVTVSKALRAQVCTQASASLHLGRRHCVPISMHSKKTSGYHCSCLLVRKQVLDSQRYTLPASLSGTGV